MTVAVNACADAYYEQAYPQRTPTLWITVTCRVCDLLAICLTQVEGRGGGGGGRRAPPKKMFLKKLQAGRQTHMDFTLLPAAFESSTPLVRQQPPATAILSLHWGLPARDGRVWRCPLSFCHRCNMNE
jgi:hypothetical protein